MSMPATPGYVEVARVDEIHEQRGTLVCVEGEEIAIFKREGQYFAMSNVCAHQHFSKLHQGQIEGFSVTCPMHGWTFDVRTGRAVSGEGRVACYDVKVIDQSLLVNIGAGK